MTPIEQLKSILSENYISEDGDEYNVELKPGLTEEQIDQLTKQLPTGKLPDDILELLKFSSGFEFSGLEEITFDGIGQFGFESIFPNSVQLAGDGLGNFWILDIDKTGAWGSVFYVCHDPAVLVKHSENLSQFIKHVDEFGKMEGESNLDIIHEKIVFDIWFNNHGLIELESARNSTDTTLKNFAVSLPNDYLIADLRNKPIRSGFAWAKFGWNDKSMRHETDLIWAIEKLPKKGFFAKLFGSK